MLVTKESIISKVNELVENKGYELLLIKDFPHKDDFFLKAVVCKKDDEFVCWTYNVNDHALYEGFYTDSFNEAYEKMIERIHQ